MQIFKAKVFYFIILITTVSCTSTAEVFFQDVVDTSDKEIKFQESMKHIKCILNKIKI